MELSYSRYREGFILDALGLELDNAGFIKFQDGGYVETVCGKDCQRIDRVGAYAHDEEQDVKLVCDHISCLVGWERHGNDTDDWPDPRVDAEDISDAASNT